MLKIAPAAGAAVQDLIRRHGGGGPRRIAENAGLVITHGDGSLLFDEAGRPYLDFATAMGVAAIGHAHRDWADRVARQAHRLAACVLHLPEQAQYLTALAEVTPPGLSRTALYSGGAEAVEVAIRLAQSVTGRKHLVAFTTGFHGKTIGTRFTGDRYPAEHRRMGVDWVHNIAYPLCQQHNAVDYPSCEGTGTASLAALDRLAAGLEGDAAAVIVEPVLGTAGNRPPERHFLAGLRRLCSERGWLLIFDESITGFGRLGTIFAAEHFDVLPDILVLGKAMGGGFPLSGVAAPPALWDRSLFAELSATSSSYGANPLACAAGLAVLDAVRAPSFLVNVNRVAAQLAQGISELAERSPYVARPRGVGMMLGFDLVDPSTRALAGPELCVTLFRRCLSAGILIVGDVPGVRLNPPLVLTEAEAERSLEALTTALCP